MIKRPSLILVEKSRRQVLRLKPREAVLGNGSGNIYAGDGMYWARWPGSADENGNATYSPPFRVFGGGKNFITQDSRRVYVVQNHKGQLEIDGAVYEDLLAAGIKPSAMNPNEPRRQFGRLDDIQNFKAIPVTTTGMKVRIGELFYVDRNGIPRFFPGSVAAAITGNPAVHVDLTSSIPATDDFECFALISFNQDDWAAGNNPLEVSVSTAQTSLPPTLGITDIQEAFAGMSDFAMPIKAFHLVNGMSSLRGSRFDLDVRDWLNVPASGTTIEITSPDGTIDIAEPVTGEFEIDVADNAITQAKMADNSVGTAEIINSNVTLAKLANGTAGTFIGFNASGVPAELDGSIDTTGATGEAWSAGNNLYLDTASNTWFKIDIDATPPKISERRGVALAAASHPSSGNRIRIHGIVSGYSGLTPGAPVYASTTAGGYTVTKPTVSVGSGQIVVYEFGYAIDATTAFIDPAPLEYLKRDWLDDDETIAITHHSDPEGHSREPDAYITRNTEVIKDQYASSNRDTDVPLLRAVTTNTNIIDAAGATNTGLGDTGGLDFRVGQLFQADATGDVISFRIRAGANAGSPTVFPSYRIETNNAVSDIPSGVVVANSSGTMTSWTASADNLITYTSPRPSLVNGTKYWFILQLSAMQATGVTYTVIRNTAGIYANGMMKWENTAGASFPDTWTLGGGTNDMRLTVTTGEVNTKLAQGFTTALEPHITGVDLWLKRTSTFTTEALTASLWLCDGSGTPTSLFETSNPVLCSDVGTSYGYIRFDYDIPVELTTNPNWAIVLERDGAELPGAYIDWGMDTSSPGHVGGEAWTYRGSTWALNSPGADACFILYGVGTYYEMPLNVGFGSPIIEAHYGDTDFDDQNTITTYENVSAAGEPRDITARLRFK
jgi:hypothetical protein